MRSLSDEQLEHFQSEGYVFMKTVYTHEECDVYVEHMMALHRGDRRDPGFPPRESDDWLRAFNLFRTDPVTRGWLLDKRLEQPLTQCSGSPVEGIQTMYFWKGSEQRRHQDQFYLPGCIAAWIAFTPAPRTWTV